MKINYTDNELLALFKEENPQSRNKAITFLFKDEKLRSNIISHLRSKGSDQDAAIDLFKDGLISLSLAIKKGNYDSSKDIRSYLFGICRYLWLNKTRAKNIIDYKDEVPELKNELTPVTNIIAEDNKLVIDNILGILKKPCKQILKLWSYGYKFSEIAQKTGYASEGMARKKKHQCWSSLLEFVQSKPELLVQLKSML